MCHPEERIDHFQSSNDAVRVIERCQKCVYRHRNYLLLRKNMYYRLLDLLKVSLSKPELKVIEFAYFNLDTIEITKFFICFSTPDIFVCIVR